MIPCGVTLPGGFEDVESVDVAMGTWSVEARLLMLCKSWLGIEVALAAKITDAECYDSFFLPYYTQIHRTAFFPLSPILS